MMTANGCECGCESPSTDPNRDCERCCLVWTIAKVAEMRAAQKAFFKHRRGDDLQRSRELEKVVDKAINKLSQTEIQKELF